MAVILTPADLAPFANIDPAKAQAMIDDAMALAARVAPCITADDFAFPQAAKAILRGAILRWNDAGTGAVTQTTVGPFGQSIDNRQQRRSLFWPSEITDLESLCVSSSDQSGAFAIDTVGLTSPVHADICALNFGGLYCSCGAVLTGLYPLYEV